jgi:hypothetical protein
MTSTRTWFRPPATAVLMLVGVKVRRIRLVGYGTFMPLSPIIGITHLSVAGERIFAND